MLCAPGEDRSASRAAPSRHEPVPGREGRGVFGEPQAREARLQGHRYRRARLRELPRASRPADRRQGRLRPKPCARRARARPHRCRGSRGRFGASGARPGARLCAVRKTFGKPIAQHQAIQLKLADMATKVRAARLLTQDAAQTYDRGLRCDLEAGMAKLFASETALEVTLEAMRIHGAYGYS